MSFFEEKIVWFNSDIDFENLKVTNNYNRSQLQDYQKLKFQVQREIKGRGRK